MTPDNGKHKKPVYAMQLAFKSVNYSVVTRHSSSHKTTRRKLRGLASALLALLVASSLAAQQCPPNIDFENGTLSNWECSIGSTAEFNGQNVITLYPSGAVTGRHTIFTALANGMERDQFGGFPVVCPNGSGFSIRLGNDQPGTEAEGVSYTFTIPSNRNEYSLIYHYAVVFQDPNHQPQQQPRMEIEITNVTDNSRIDCSSFTFIPNGSSLPGFFESPTRVDNSPIWCKDWSAVSINLDGNAGKTIRLMFKTADCTFRRHFGYAYIDVNSECSNEFVGATYCPGDTAINVTAPHGYQGYTWFNNNFTQVLGNQQSIRFSPPPPQGTSIAVQLVPYDGYGCLDTLYAQLVDTLTVKAFAGNNALACNGNTVQLGANPKPGLTYSWSPAAGLSNAGISNPLASPAFTTNYVLTVSNYGGGCVDRDTVLVNAANLDTTIQFLGKKTFCEGYGDSCILIVQPADSIQWYRNNMAIPGANQTRYNANKSGSYYAMLFSQNGCRLATTLQEVFIDRARAGVLYPVQYAVADLPIPLAARPFGIAAQWSPATYLDNAGIFTPVFTGSRDQVYDIQITTSTGCVTTDRQPVKIIPKIDIYVPTAFTPNNDGLNDLLRPTLMGIKELRYFRVFNRWGQQLFESREQEQGWDGKLQGLLQGTQVLVWMAEGLGVDNKIYQRKGTTTLIR